jgi:hypothetical protein
MRSQEVSGQPGSLGHTPAELPVGGSAAGAEDGATGGRWWGV